MKKILLGMAAVSALAISAPAAAQFSNGYQNGYQTRGYARSDVSARVQQLRVDIQAGLQRGTISRQEAIRLDQQAIQLFRTEQLYSRNGLSGRERGDLMQRLNNLRQQIRYAERTGNGRFDRDDRFGDRDGRFGRNDRWEDDRRDRDGRYDRNDRWEDRDHRDRRWNERTGRWEDRDDRFEDRDRRWNERTGRWEDRNDRWEDRDRRYEPQQRGGIAGILGSILGGNVGLRVGQRATGNLYGLPYEFRNQFRDGNGVYYRTDGRVIYQIDARTNTVVRIYSMNR